MNHISIEIPSISTPRLLMLSLSKREEPTSPFDELRMGSAVSQASRQLGAMVFNQQEL